MTKLQSIFAVILFGILLQTCGDKGCDQFKTGSFIYNFRGQDEKFYFTINRNDSIQTETNSKIGHVSTLHIKWIDECNYELRFLGSTANYPDSILRIRRGTILRNQIIQSTKDYYIFRTESDKSDFVLTDTLWIKK